MCSSTRWPSSWRATSATSPARMTAPSGSYRYPPRGPRERSGRVLKSSPLVSSAAPRGPRTRAARRTPGRRTALNHRSTSVTSPSTETHCASQSPGRNRAAFRVPSSRRRRARSRPATPRRTAAGRNPPDPRSAWCPRSTWWPGGIEPDAVDPLERNRGRIRVDHGRIAEQDQVHRGARGCGLVHFHRGNHQVHRRQGHRIRPQPAAEVRHVADSGSSTNRCACRAATVSRVACSRPPW